MRVCRGGRSQVDRWRDGIERDGYQLVVEKMRGGVGDYAPNGQRQQRGGRTTDAQYDSQRRRSS